MATWQARAQLSAAAVTTTATDEAVAAAELTTAIQTALPGWTADQVQVRATYAAGEWVVAKRTQSAPEEYARIVAGTPDNRVQFADGTQRALGTVVRRV